MLHAKISDLSVSGWEFKVSLEASVKAGKQLLPEEVVGGELV